MTRCPGKSRASEAAKADEKTGLQAAPEVRVEDGVETAAGSPVEGTADAASGGSVEGTADTALRTPLAGAVAVSDSADSDRIESTG